MEHIFTEVAYFYLKVCAVLMTYHAGKFYSQHYEFKTMSFLKKLWHYTKGILVIAVIAFLGSFNYEGGEDDDHPAYPTSQHPQRGIIIFVVLIIPLLIGIEEGKHGEKLSSSYTPTDDDL